MQTYPGLTLSIIMLLAGIGACGRSASAEEARQETVLDRRVTLHEGIVEVPEVPPLCDAIDGLAKRRVEVEGGSLYCETEGSGAPLVLVSGGPGCSHQVFHPSFSRAAEFAQVIYYDQRGTGNSEADPTGARYTLKQAVADLDRLRAELGLGRWIVLGHSYGGLLAQCYALEHPDRVMGLVLVCASSGLPGVHFERTRQYDFLSQEELARIREIHREPGLSLPELVYNTHLAGDWKRQSYYLPSEAKLARTARYEWTPAPGLREGLDLDVRFVDLEGKFRDFTIPTLLIESTWDLTWNTDKPTRLKENHPHGRLVMFERSGHSPFDDEPARFFSVLADFVAEAKACRPAEGVVAQTVGYPPPLVADIESLGIEGSGEQALDLLAKAEAESLTIPQGWVHLGLCLYADEHYPEALRAFGRAAELVDSRLRDLNRSAAYTWQGHIYDLMGRREKALACYRKALEYGEDLGGETWDQWGIDLDAVWLKARLEAPFVRTETARRIEDLPWNGAGEEARELLARARKEGLNSRWTWLKLGTSLYGRGDYPEALDAFQTLCGNRPDFAAGFVWQGQMLDLLGRREEALECYREAKAIGMPRPMRLDAYEMTVDTAWIEARLERPFTRQ